MAGEGRGDGFESVATVLDVNVWIDGCKAVRRGADLTAHWRSTGQHAGRSVQSLALLTGLAAPSTAELLVGIDTKLVDTILRKLSQPLAAARAEDRGLGWDLAEAQTSLRDLVGPLERAGRIFTVDPPAGDGGRGDDYEDRRIFGLFAAVMAEQPTCLPILITYDRGLVAAAMEDVPRLQQIDGSPSRPAWLAGPAWPLLRQLQKHAI